MRLFVAVPVPEDMKEKLAEVQEKIAKISDAKLVEPENLHFTVKFLGEVNEKKTREIMKTLEKSCRNFSPFDISIAGVSAFPSRNYARVIWISVTEGFQELESLINAVDEELSHMGFDKDKEHIPHLTLARVRSGMNNAELITLLKILEKTEIGKMKVNEVKLMKSILSRSGIVYEEVYSVKLK